MFRQRGRGGLVRTMGFRKRGQVPLSNKKRGQNRGNAARTQEYHKNEIELYRAAKDWGVKRVVNRQEGQRIADVRHNYKYHEASDFRDIRSSLKDWIALCTMCV